MTKGGNTPRRKPILISIEGNIGAGKSTLLKSLQKSLPNWKYIDEPVNFWSTLLNDDGRDLLTTFYGDTNRYAFTFQVCALLSRYQVISKHLTACDSENEVFITERCLHTDYKVFAKKLREDGSINKLEFSVYEKYFQHFSETMAPLDAIIYVNTLPDKCLQRIKQRARPGEENISIQYLDSLHKWTDEWIGSTNLPVVRKINEKHELTTEELVDDIGRMVDGIVAKNK